ncbi:PREDICTED: UBX domain-containing protein 4 isoform X2 [Eufriesea mexicana]|uniref:UBX domain-containing protein 4 isoform X2 n=1 Tax=Eufriesea mexicana TaxID=516756 RepID=UPI00083C5A32|nr:PREDICTED: UBX domain-containing protein 4 isoform X2 [Eufriesea mexicana]
MKWFEGSINEAVATSKSRKAIFVVFVEGKDDTSAQIAEAINTTEVSCRLEQEDFVAIRLESGSDTYRFFAQIYQLVPVPSLFFIGENGTPLEIIAGYTSATDLVTKIDLVLSKVGKNKNASVNLINAEQKATSADNAINSNVMIDVDKKNDNVIKSNVEAPITSESESNNIIKNDVKEEASTSLKVNEPSEPVNETKVIPAKELTTEEKIARAQRLIELQNKQRIEEEARKEKEREIERRKVGRGVQKLRQKQQDFEIKQAYEEKMKEKAADAVAREKVLQQIAQDKLERKQKVAIQQHVQPQNDSEPSEPPISMATISRIQFRLPSGNPYIAQFEPTNTLRDLRTYVVKNINLPFRHFPRRELTNEDDDKTLLELELVPTAVILILPLKNSNVTTNVSSASDVHILPQFVWSTFAIFTAVYYYLLRFFTGDSRKSTKKESSNSAENKDAGKNAGETVTSNVQNIASTSGLVRRYLGSQGSATIKTEGNIHRLHSSGDDNDENNTWNGNSTQQM